MLDQFSSELAPEMLLGGTCSRESDVYSLCFVVCYVLSQMRLRQVEQVILGLADNPEDRPVARDVLKALIRLRS